MADTSLQPASLHLREDGTPFSAIYGDVYHTAAGGLQQAREVFLTGNRLPERWCDRRRFVVLETGFGLGLNFLATWAAWRQDPNRCDRLHFVSVEKHPFTLRDLARAHTSWPELAAEASELQAEWPELTPGFHRLSLAGGRVILTLLFGDALEQLQQLECRADAIFLDGFAPGKNPEMWSSSVFAELARLSSADATLATWSVSGEVRRGLAAVGFECTKHPGRGSKRELLRGHRHAGVQADTVENTTRHALVIGAGLAGTSIAERLAARGWRIDLIDGEAGPGRGASGNHAGVLRPLPSLDDNPLARLTRAGSLFAAHLLRQMERKDLPIRWDPCGVLHLARDPRHEQKQQAIVTRHGYPPSFLRFVDRSEASGIAGWPVELGGWWFPGGGWVQPHSLCAANIASQPGAIRCLFGKPVATVERVQDQWHARDAQGVTIASAPLAILANGTEILGFPDAAILPVRSARGQVSHFSVPRDSAPKVVVCRLGYVSPSVDGTLCAGATFSVDDPDAAWRETDHAENLAKLDFILPGLADAHRESAVGGRVGFRPASPDRLPIVGALPTASSGDLPTSLSDLPRQPGLFAVSGFGARGLVWAGIVAETLASQLDGDPLPIERDLVAAIDPGRYILRPVRTQRLRGEA